MSILSFVKRYAVAAGGATYAFTAGVRHGRHRTLIGDIARHFGYDDHPARLLPTVAVDTITSARTQVTLTEARTANGNVSLLELLVLARLVRERRPRAIFEIGTFDGRTTLNLAENAAADAVIRTLDLPRDTPTRIALTRADRAFVEKDASGARFAKAAAGRRITQLYGDSASFDFAPYPSDFIFVDGSHSYAYVMSDSNAVWRMLPDSGGTIIWHDYGAWEGVTRALNELQARDLRFKNLRWVEDTTLVVLDVPARS